jgi:hypothetical protein
MPLMLGSFIAPTTFSFLWLVVFGSLVGRCRLTQSTHRQSAWELTS